MTGVERWSVADLLTLEDYLAGKQATGDPTPAPGQVGTILILQPLVNLILSYHRELLGIWRKTTDRLVTLAGEPDLNKPVGGHQLGDQQGDSAIRAGLEAYLEAARRRFPAAFALGQTLAARSTGRPALSAQETATLVRAALVRNEQFVRDSLFADLRQRYRAVLRDEDLPAPEAAVAMRERAEGLEFRAGDMYSRKLWGMGHKGFAEEMRAAARLMNWVVTSDNPCPDCPELQRNSPYGPDNPLPTVPGQGDTQCWLDPTVRVLTQKGWKPIKEIEIGELVLTHAGQWRTVSALPVQGQTHAGPVIEVTVKPKDDQSHRRKRSLTLCMTPDHRLMVAGEWVHARDLRKGQWLSVMTRACAGCTKTLPVRGRDFWRQFCSATCYHRNPRQAGGILGQLYSVQREGLKIQRVRTLTREGAAPLSLWDLTVEQDESYLVNAGIVSHNCRTNCLCLLVEIGRGAAQRPRPPEPERPAVPTKPLEGVDHIKAEIEDLRRRFWTGPAGTAPRSAPDLPTQEVERVGKLVRAQVVKVVPPELQAQVEAVSAQVDHLITTGRDPVTRKLTIEATIKIQQLFLQHDGLFKTYSAALQDATTSTLRQIRPLGPPTPGTPLPVSVDTTGTARPVFERLPSAWLQRIAPHNFLASVQPAEPWDPRGSYDPQTRIIRVTNRPPIDGGPQACTFHEIGHYMEDQIPEIKTAMNTYYDERTAGEPAVDLATLHPEGSYKPGQEFTKPDKFARDYMGKRYPGGFTELFSMGLEGVFRGTVSQAKDPAFHNFILGILAVL